MTGVIPMRHLIAVLTTALAVATPLSRAQTQTETQERGRTGTAPRQQQKEKDAEKHIDREVAIAHALCMSIEGSGLWACAQHAGAAKAPRTEADPARPGPGGVNQPAGILELHARQAFEASNKLFATAEKEKGTAANGAGRQDNAKSQACEEFCRAAREYSQALEGLCHQKGKEAAQAENERPREGRAPAGAMLSEQDAAKVAVINHAVKEAVEGVGLKQMLRHHNDRDATAHSLMTHAEQMLASSRQAIQAIEGAGEARGAVKPAAEEGRTAKEPASAASLARLGREVIESVQRLDADSNPTPTARRSAP
jgi:hypothetical protein